MNLRDYLAAANIPAFEADLDDEPSMGHVHIRSDKHSWDWFIAEYDPASGRAFGLVNGAYLEYGDIDIDEVMDAAPDARVVEDFVPTPLAEIHRGCGDPY